jgi:23S rRNA pseudouridine1911/1915/1917 synthase
LLDLIHEDDDLLVVNKPAGLVCHPTRGDESSSLIGRVRLHLGHSEGRLVNRLDRETSGLVLIARSAATAGELGRLFSSHSSGGAARKNYWAIVHGWLTQSPSTALTIDAPLGRDVRSAVAIKDCVREDGSTAETHIEVLDRFDRNGAPFSWLDVRPLTGRKHQIRIHLAHAGHPIVGDKIYGADEQIYLRFIASAMTPDDERRLILPNHALHARSLSFSWRGKSWTFEAGPPAFWREWLGLTTTLLADRMPA